MSHLSAKTRLIAAVTVLAVMLACVFAAILYTRTSDIFAPEASIEEGESATAYPLDYGDPYVGDSVPSGAVAISDQTGFYNFITGTASYGYLTTNITLSSWPRGDLRLDSNQTLDGRGCTVTINNSDDDTSVAFADYTGTHIVTDVAQYNQWWAATGSTLYILPGGQQTYAFSDIVSANYGTIKNLKVSMNGNGDGNRDHIFTVDSSGNAVAGVLVGYNAGNIVNCSVTVNDKYGILPTPYAVVGENNIQAVSKQNMTAVGGITGYNSGNILGSKLTLNGDIGIYASQLRLRTSIVSRYGRVYNLSTDSSSVGGVAGINDGGTISGIDAYGGDCWVYNDAWHNQTSYTGFIVGLGNATASNAQYALSGEYNSGVNWTIRPGIINNLTLSWHENFAFASESYATNATVGMVNNYGRTINGQAWYGVGTYIGIIGGRLGTSATNTSLANYINVYNTNFGDGRWNYHPWSAGEFSSAGTYTYTLANSQMPLFGYGDGQNNYIKYVNTPTTRLDGQARSGNSTDLSTQGVSSSYMWAGEVENGTPYAGLLQNTDLGVLSDLNGRSFNIFRFEGYVDGARTTHRGSDNIYGSGLQSSQLLRMPASSTGGNLNIEYRYSITLSSFPDINSVNAFFGTDASYGYGYAYANAVVLGADTTVSGTLNPSGNRIFPDWKTLDGGGHQLAVSNTSETVSGTGVSVSVGGQTFNAYGDFISVNYGSIFNITFRQLGSGSRGDISGVSGNVAYGNIVGVNYGTINGVYHNNLGGEALRTVVSTAGGYLALGGIAGINLGSINGTASITWQDMRGSATTGTFVGGIVGLNVGAGEIRNAKIDGVLTATMSASGGEAYLGGILGLGANGTDGGRTVGALTVSSTLTSSPFASWFFVGKQTMDHTSGSYIGMLAGGVTSDPTETDRPLTGMIVMMPDTQYDVGWFTPYTNTPSLLGRSDGTASDAGYIATSMVGGYSIVGQDASNLYITPAVEDYNGSVDALGGFFGGFYSRLDTFAYSWDLPSVSYEYISGVTATVADAGTDASGRLIHNISIPSTAAQISAVNNSNNPNNYAQTIALRYDYTVNLNQSSNDADNSTSQHALYLFLSGDALGAGLENYPGVYKAIAAGATSAVVTSNLTVNANPNGIVFQAPKDSIEGNGYTITINGDFGGVLQGGATYDFGGVRNVYGELVAVNRGTINNLNIVVNGSRDLDGSNLVYGLAVGVNNGTLNNTVVTQNGAVIVSSDSGYNVAGAVGINAYPSAMGVDNFVSNAPITLDGGYTEGYLGMVGINYESALTNAYAAWTSAVSMSGGGSNTFGGVVASISGNSTVGPVSATFGYDKGWQGYLDGRQYTERLAMTFGGNTVVFGGVAGSMSGGTMTSSSSVMQTDVYVKASASSIRTDVGGAIGIITGGSVSGLSVSGIGALALDGGTAARFGGAIGAAGSSPTIGNVKMLLGGGLYNLGTRGAYGWISGYNESGVTMGDSVFVVHDDKGYSTANVFGGTPTLSGSVGGIRIKDNSDNDVDYAAIDPDTMTIVSIPVFATSVQTGTLSPTNGGIAEYVLGASVNVYTNDNARDEYMLRSALAGVPYASGIRTDFADYAQSRDRYYGWYAGALNIRLVQSAEISAQDYGVTLNGTDVAFVFGEGRTLDGNSSGGYSITVTGDMNYNIAPQEMVWREETDDGTTEIVNTGLYAAKGMFVAVNKGSIENCNVIIGGTSGDGDITVDFGTALGIAEDRYPSDSFTDVNGTPVSDYTGLIFGMLVGVNSGSISGFNALDYNRVTTVTVSSAFGNYDLIVGGMVGAQIGDGASVSGVGKVTFGADDGIIVTGNGRGTLNRISVGGLIGMVSNEANDTEISGLEVLMQANSFVDVNVSHRFAAVGGIVGDLRGIMTDARIDTEYLSRLLINGTLPGGTAAMGGLAGVANGATIERAVVKGVGYMYNGITTESASASGSVDHYSGGAIGLASNYAPDSTVASTTYKLINPSYLDSIYVDFEGYLRAVAGSKVGIVTGRLFDGVTVDAVGAVATMNINTDRVKNIVWKVNYYGDTEWASNAYIDNVSTVFNERADLAVFGYAPAVVDGYDPATAAIGMRLWVTNNRYSGETNNEIDADWQSNGNLRFSITNLTGAQDYESFTAYFNGATDGEGNALEGEQGITRVQTYHSLDSGAGVQPSATVDVADRLNSFTTASGMTAAHGVYVIRFVFNEVLIYNQAELMTFISSGKNTVTKVTVGATNVSSWMYGLSQDASRYNEIANADYGVLANNIEVNFGATAVTMPANKTLDGQGFTVTLTASGQVNAYQIWTDRGEAVAAEDRDIGVLLEGETLVSYVSGGETAGNTDPNTYVVTDQGTSHFHADNIAWLTTSDGRVGASVGGLFMGRNLGTISNINFVLPNSVDIYNRRYGSLLVAGAVTAVNAGTIENCSLTINEGVTFRAFRDDCDNVDNANNLDNNNGAAAINTVATVGGYAGMMFKYNARSNSTAYIRNSTLDLKTGSAITVDNEFPTFTWIGRYTRVISYSGGLVGWMLNGGEIYNIIINGEGDIKALASFNGGNNIWNSSYMVGVAGAITGMNAVYPAFSPIIEVGHTQDNFGTVNGVICNWNGNVEYNARDDEGVGGSRADYYYADRWNYSVGGQMLGITQINTTSNIYFMYGVENYATYHRDNWWYGDNPSARNNDTFRSKYDYIVNQSLKLLRENPAWDAIYAAVAVGGQDQNAQLTPVAKRVDGEVVQGELFTFENYNNYNSAEPEHSATIFNGVSYRVDNNLGFQLYKTDLDANGNPTYYDDITRTAYHKIVELYRDTQTDEDAKEQDYVGTRTSARLVNISKPQDMSQQYSPNNVYIYEIGFGETEARELDMNDPNTVASMTFETDQITSDIKLDFELYTDEAQAQFIWSITEEWNYPDSSGIADTSQTTDYYETVNSLEAALRNNKFDRTMRRDNDSVTLTFTYKVGAAVAIAPDMNRYTEVSEEDDEGNITSMVYYDGQPQLYNAQAISPPTIYYVNYVTREQLSVATVNQSMFTYWRIPDGGSLDSAESLGSVAPSDVGEYSVRLSFEGAGSEGLRVNLTDRTIMFGLGTDYYDFYTAILPKGLTSSQISEISKTYDGTDDATAVTVFTISGLVGGDVLRIKGNFEQANVGEGLDFTVDTTGKAYVRTVTNGVVTVHEMAVITAVSGELSNYAYVKSSLSDASQGVAANLGKYYAPGEVARISGSGVIDPYEINRGGITFRLTNGDGTVLDFETNTNVEYRNGYVYDTSSFYGTIVPVGGSIFYLDENGEVTDGLFADDDSLQFSFTFADAASATNKGDYAVEVTMTSANGNYVLTGTGSIGMLHILAIILDDTAYFVYEMDDIERVYDGTSTLPAFGGRMVVTDKNGHVLTEGVDYEIELGFASTESPLNVGQYELRVNVLTFDGKGNYELDGDMDYTFIPENGSRAAYLFVTPKEIAFESIVKEYDNTGNADNAVYTFADGYEPIEADVEFSGVYSSPTGTAGYTTIGEGKLFTLNTDTLTFDDVNGTRRSYIVLDVTGDSGNVNYFVSDETVEVGGITPVEVELTSASKIYDNKTTIDYTAEGTSVTIIRVDNSSELSIQPSAYFDTQRTGERKTVYVDTVTVGIYGVSYDVLVNSDLSDVTDVSGWNYSGNYYVASESFMSIGQIVQYTIEWEHISSLLEVVQTEGSREGDSTGFSSNGNALSTLVYKNGYTVEGVIRSGVIGGWPDEDPVQDLISFEMLTDAAQSGYAGSYTLVLMIVSKDQSSEPDYVWGDFNNKNSEGNLEFTFEIERQTITADAVAEATPGTTVWDGSSVSVDFAATVIDNDGVVLTLDTDGASIVNDTLGGNYANGDALPIGNYSATVDVLLSGDDALNYIYNGGEPVAEFSVIPAQVSIMSVQKEYDDTTALDTSGNEAVISASVPSGEIDFDAVYVSALPQTGGGVRFAAETYVIGGTEYFVLVERDGSVSNYTVQNTVVSSNDESIVINVGRIDKYMITAAELGSYVYGWMRGQTDKQRREVTDGNVRFEYRDNGIYYADEVEFELTGMRYGLSATVAHSPVVSDSVGSVLDFAVRITGVGADVSEGNGRVLNAGEYAIEITLDNECFELAPGITVVGEFVIDKQSVSGGNEGEGGYAGGNVLVTADLFSYAYGEGSYNTPSKDDAKVVLTVTVYDTYSKAQYVYGKEVVGQILYGDEQTDTLSGEVLVGEYKLWATQFADSIQNYLIDESAILPVFVTGTVLPDGTEVDESGAPVGIEQGAIYAITPAQATLSSVSKIYDGTTSFDGATVSAVPAEISSAIDGSFVSPEATHGSDGTETGEGSRDVTINVYDIVLQGVTYHVIAESGVAANYYVAGEYAEGTVLVPGVASIYKLTIESLDMLSVTSQTFGKEYDGTSVLPTLPEMTLTVTTESGVITVTFTPEAAELALSANGEEVLEALHVGAYGVSVMPEGLGNFEMAGGLGNVPVNGGDAVYFVEPKAVTLDQLAKTYDGTADVTAGTVQVFTGVLDGEQISFAVSFADASVGTGKTAVVSVEQFAGADGTVFDRIVGADGSATDYYVTGGTSDGTTMLLQGAGYTISPAELTVYAPATKTYDGTAEIVSTAAQVFTGFVSGETIQPDWTYDDKDSGARDVLVRVDASVPYTVGELVYYALYSSVDGVVAPGNYGILFTGDNIVEREVEIVGEDGQVETVTYSYALFAGEGQINPYAITGFDRVLVAGTDISVAREYGSSYTLSAVSPSFDIGGTTVTAAFSSGYMTATTPYGDTLRFNAAFSPSPVRDAGSYTLSISLNANTNYTMSAYSGTFVIVPKELDALFIVVPDIVKIYDGTSDLPSVDTSLWHAYGMDGSVVLDMSSSVTFGENGGIVFVEEDGVLPINVRLNEDGSVGGYLFELHDVVLTSNNYYWDGGIVTDIPTSYTFEAGKGERSMFVISPYVLTLDQTSFVQKTFDGVFSLTAAGVPGEYVTIGDLNGFDSSLAGVYANVAVSPVVTGVTFDSTAPNPTTIAANYTAVAADGAAIVFESLTIGTGNVLTAERVLGGYRVGLGDMAGYDFLFESGIVDEALRLEIETKLNETAVSGLPWHEDSYVAGGAMAKLGEALAALFEIRLNGSDNTLVLGDGKYYFNDFLWQEQTDAMGRKTYSLTFSFAGADDYDADDYATDRYEFVLKGTGDTASADYIPSTNASLTSSELASGQLATEGSVAGIAISTAEELLEFLGGNGTGYLTADIYGFDAAGAELTFGGVLYGNGHTIQLTPSDLASASSGSYQAYGALVAVNNGTIRDLTLKIMGRDLAFDGQNAVFGAIGVNNGNLVNVGVEILGKLDIDGAAYVGGLVGVNSSTITDCSITVSGQVDLTSTTGEVTVTGGVFGGIAGYGQGTMTRVAAYGDAAVSAAEIGAIVGVANGLTVNGVIAAANIGGNAIVGSGSASVSNVYVDTAAPLGTDAQAIGGILTILDPYPEGYIDYYFTSLEDFSTGGVRHNEVGGAGERNMSGYGVYASDLGGALIAIEAIAPAGRYVWEGYGLRFNTEITGGAIGTALNRVVGVFAIGTAIDGQYDGTDTQTGGVGAYTVAFGIYGSTVVADVTASVKEVIYNGQAQSYEVTLTVDGESKPLRVTGTDVGYYSRSSVEGIITGDSESIGNITFDIDNRTAITVESGGGSVADGIALIIHPKTADQVVADKYYDGNSDATALVSDSTVHDEGELGGVHVNADNGYAATPNVNEATHVAIVNASTAVRNVAVDADGNFVALVASIEGNDESAHTVYELVPVTIGEDDAPFGPDTDLGAYTVEDIMRAYAMLTDFDALAGVEGIDVTGYSSVAVFAITGTWDGDSYSGDQLYFAPRVGNLVLTDTAWVADLTTMSADGFDWSSTSGYVVAARIMPIDLHIGVTISGADQSYRYPIQTPTTAGGAATVNMTFEEAQAAYGITREEYDVLVGQTQSISVAAVSGLFEQLIADGAIVERNGQYFAAEQKYQSFAISTSDSGSDTDSSGNFIVGAEGTLTLRYFEPEIVDGKTTYLLGSVADWEALRSNEGGTADYNTLDYRLSADIDFDGNGAMLAWRDAEGAMLDFTGTLDGDGFILSGIFEFNAGNGAKSALFESIGETGVVNGLTVVDSVFDAYGDNAAAAGIAIDNHGTITGCVFEGTLASGNDTASRAALAGIVVNNYGKVVSAVSVADALVFAAEDGSADAVGIAIGAAAESSTQDSKTVFAVYAYGGAEVNIGGAVTGVGGASGNAFADGLAVKDGVATNEADTASGSLGWKSDAAVKAVIENYVFDSALIGWNGSVLDTDNFRKLIAVLRLFEFVGTADVSNASASAWGKYAQWLAANGLN